MRVRDLKPGFFTNEDLGALPPLARLLFAGLWCLADCLGRLEDRPLRIKVSILPYDDCNVDELLSRLRDAKFISRYVVADQKYIQINTFRKHQHPHPKEAASAIPAPEAVKSNCLPCNYTELNGKVEPCNGKDTPLLEKATPFREIIPIPSSPSSPSITSSSSEEESPSAGGGGGEMQPEGKRTAATIARNTSPTSEEVQDAWNRCAQEAGWHQCQTFGKERQSQLRARRKDTHWVANWRRALEIATPLLWLRGHGKDNWIAGIEWFLRPSTVAKILEGSYNDRKPAQSSVDVLVDSALSRNGENHE